MARKIKWILTAVVILLMNVVAFSQQLKLGRNPFMVEKSAVLDLESPNQGLLFPRIADTTQISALNPPDGMVIFYIPSLQLMLRTGGYWQPLSVTASLLNYWSVRGNSGTVAETNFLGTTDLTRFTMRTNNIQRFFLDSVGSVAIGEAPLFTSGLNREKLLVDAGGTSSVNVISGKGAIDDRLQVNIQNNSSGTMASSDLVAAANNAGEGINFVDLGINSSGFTDQTRPVLSGINNAYLYSTGNDFIIGNATATKNLQFFTGGFLAANERIRIDGTGKIGIGTSAPTAALHLKPGTITVNTAPLKFTSGALLTTPEAGAIEYLTDKFYATITTAAARKEFTLNEGALTSGRLPFATTNGRLTDVAALTYLSNRLSPTYITLGAGTTVAGTAPLVFTSGAYLSTPVAGALEFLTDNPTFTIATGTARKQFTLNDAPLTSGRVPYTTTNGRLIDNASMTYSANRLAPTYLTLAAGTATAGTAPLLMTPGVNLTAPVAGAIEFDGTHFYGTIGSTRYPLDDQAINYQAGPGLSLFGVNFRNNLTIGIVGDQTVVGGSAAGNSLILSSTNSPQKGKIILGISAYDETTNRLGIGNNIPTETLDVTGNIKFSGALMPNNLAGTAGYLLQSNGSGAAPTWVANSSSAAWSLVGNSGTVDGTSFLGTTDNIALNFRANNLKAGRIDPAGPTFIGYQAGNSNTAVNTTGFGFKALFSSTTGINNTATGYSSLTANSTGFSNSAFGFQSLSANTTASHNTAVGTSALGVNTTGSGNTAVGSTSLNANITGTNNTALGYGADVGSGALTNATAIGYNAIVTANNSMVLGGTGANQVNVGLGTTAPNSTLTVNGSVTMKVRLVAGVTTTLTGTDYIVINTTGGSVSWYLPAASTCPGRVYILVNHGTSLITIFPGIRFSNTAALATINLSQNQGSNTYEIISDGTDWRMIN